MEILYNHVSGRAYVPPVDTIDACFVGVYLLEITSPMLKQNIDCPELPVLSEDHEGEKGDIKLTKKPFRCLSHS